ncbi:MAG: glycosyltransferase family 2 protein [Nitriliruptorales bacterium]|nr:glycosyltransferase family 2 protein [Nitriliruptorales bacterium]
MPRTDLDPRRDAIERQATTEFWDRYDPPFNPVVVVIPALNERESIGDVLDRIPDELGGQPSTTLVMDDGSTDGTAELARDHGALVCRLEVNIGQGAAFRLGYRLAREGGAEIIATIDSDGQYVPEELEDVVAPVARGEADLVIGSRVLGNELTTDRYRAAGVRFFGWLASVLGKQRLTDTSSGLRAMRAEVTAKVRLDQTQYQTSELLMGALAHGFRVTEVPTTMQDRTAGASKKGNELLYGVRYARAMIGTWLRERS